MADIGIKIGVEGEKSFKSTLKSINDELKVSASEMQMLAAKYDGNEKSVEALTEKQKALQKQLAGQKEAVKTISEALENAKNSFGEADARTLAWQKKLNDAEAAVYKTEKAIRDNDAALEGLNSETGVAAKSEAELKAAAEKTAKEMEEQKKKVDEAKKTLLDYSKAAEEKAAKALKALTAAAAGTVTAVSALVLKAGSAADELGDMSKVTGLSTTQLQRYTYIANMAGTSLDTITGAQTKLVKNMASAQKGTGDAAKAFSALGVSVTDANGQLRNSDDVFNDVIGALGRIENETERDVTAMTIFGKSAKDLNPLILEGAEGMKAYADEAEELGIIVSEETVNALGDMQAKVKTVTAQFDALKTNLAAKFAPIAKTVLEKVQKIIKSVSDTLDSPKMKAAVDKLGKALKDFLTKAADLAEKILPHLVSAVTFVVQNFDKLAISLGVVIGIFKGVQIITGFAKAFSAVKTALETLRATSAATTTAVEGMSSAMSASSTAAAGWIGVILAAVAALAAANSAINKALDEAKAKASESSRALREEIENAKSSFDDYNDKYTETTKTTEETAKKASEYVARLKELEKQSSLTAEEQDEYNSLIKKLQVLMPSLNLQINKNTGLLKDGAGALDDQIENWKKLAKLEATKGALEEAYKNQFELDRLSKEAASSFRETSDLWWKWKELWNKQASGAGLAREEYEELQNITTRLTGANYDFVTSGVAVNEAYEQARAAANEAWTAWSKNETLIGELEDSYLGLSSEVENTTDAEGDLTEGVNKASTAVMEHAQKIDELADEHYKKIINAATDIFNKIKTTTDMSMKDIVETLKHNRQAIVDYEANMRTIAERGASEDVMNYLESLGVEQAGVIDLIAKSTDKEFKDFVNNFDKNVTQTSVESQRYGYRVGAAFSEGVAEGANDKISDAEKAARKLAKRIQACFKQELDINSPSRVMRADGQNAGQGAVLGVLDMLPKAEKASQDLARALTVGFDPSAAASLNTVPGPVYAGAASAAMNGNTYNYYVSDPSPAFYEAVMQGVDRRFGGLYA